MPHNQPEALDRTPTPRYVGILLLIMLIGLPVLVMSGLFVKSVPGRVVEGEQPGGVLHGRLIDDEGRPISGVNVMLWLADPAEGGGFSATTAPDVEPVVSGSDGRFELSAPAHNGHYQIVAEADLWIGVRKSVTLIDRDGGAFDPGEIEMTLEPGCHLRIEIVDSTGAPAGRGDFDLRGKEDSGPLFGLLGGSRSMSGTILNGVLERGGLPSMEATIVIQMDNGKTATMVLPLAPGSVRERIEL